VFEPVPLMKFAISASSYFLSAAIFSFSAFLSANFYTSSSDFYFSRIGCIALA